MCRASCVRHASSAESPVKSCDCSGIVPPSKRVQPAWNHTTRAMRRWNRKAEYVTARDPFELYRPRLVSANPKPRAKRALGEGWRKGRDSNPRPPLGPGADHEATL